jgi:hypothetical protein
MAPGRDDEKKPGFTVSDRRSFADAVTGPAQAATDAGKGESPVAPSAESLGELGAAAWEPSSPIDFHTFILSLGSSALLHLGELDGPDGTAGKPELALAKHTIDVIAMLQAKTKGNLTPPEANLVESLLYDLRLRYFEKSKTPG